MNNELDYREDVELKAIRDNRLRIEADDLPITIVFEGRKEYVLKEAQNGIILNKKD